MAKLLAPDLGMDLGMGSDPGMGADKEERAGDSTCCRCRDMEQPKRVRCYLLTLLVALALLDFREGGRAPIAFAAPSASCSESAAEYITRLDPLFDRERRDLTSFIALKDFYFPLRSCNIDELISIVSKSRYVPEMAISFGGTHIIKFGNGRIKTGFS